MKILILSNLYPPVVHGGYEQACASVAAALVSRGHDVRVLTCHAPGSECDPSYVVRAFEAHWFIPAEIEEAGARALQLHHALCSSYANSCTLTRHLAEFEPDIVYVWNLFGIGMAGLLELLVRAGAPFVIHLMDRMPGFLHDNVPDRVRDVFDARGAALWERGRIISMSLRLLDEIERDCGFSLHEDAAIVPGWVDLGHAVPHRPYREGTTRFVFASAVGPHKGIDLVICSASALTMEGLAFEVDVYGSGELPVYTERAAQAGLSGRMRFHGQRAQRELLSAYACADAFLFPTWEREPFGFAPVEAAGCGTLPIITAACGASERFVGGVHAVKIERNAASLAAAMRDVIEGRIDVARMGRAAARLVRDDLSFDKCLRRIERILAEAVRPWNRAPLREPTFGRLTYMKHDLATRLRFGII